MLRPSKVSVYSRSRLDRHRARRRPASAAEQDVFDCYAATPRSQAYDAGDFARAFKELQPLAIDRCPQASRWLAILYAQGRGAPHDLVRAYAYLLLAFSEGVTPFGGAAAGEPNLGDDPHEFEIVQFGMKLSEDQLAAAEKLAGRLIGANAISSNGAVGPTGIADTIKELRPRREAYQFKGRLATLRFPRGSSALAAGMRRAGDDRILAQAVSELNDVGVPHELLYIEEKMKERGSGSPAGRQEIERQIEAATAKGEHFVWLAPGVEVRLVKYGVNSNFASQVAPTVSAGGEAGRDVYWIDTCLIEFEEPRIRRGRRPSDPTVPEKNGSDGRTPSEQTGFRIGASHEQGRAQITVKHQRRFAIV